MLNLLELDGASQVLSLLRAINSGISYVNLSLAVAGLIPLEVVTVTSICPDDREGVITLICVGLTTLKQDVAAHVAVILVEPKLTAVAVIPDPSNPLPVIVTAVPPPAGPACGETFATKGPLP